MVCVSGVLQLSSSLMLSECNDDDDDDNDDAVAAR